MELERVKITGLNKDISPRGVDNGGNRLLVNPLLDAVNCRYHTSETGEIESLQNIPGTVGYDITGLPVGTNLIIGTFTDMEGGRLILFNWNSGGQHGIYSWNPTTNVFSTLIVNSLLAFSNNPRYRITGIGIAQNLLYWTDGLNPQRMINMTRSYAGITDQGCINMYARPPIFAPKIMSSDIDVAYNSSAIATNIYQFATRYNYKDKGYSPLSQWSEVYLLTGADTITDFNTNRVTVRAYMQVEVQSIIEKVELLYRKNNSPDWFVYKVLAVTDFTAGVADVYFMDDNSNQIVPQNESNKIFDSMPLRSKSLSLFRNRNFLVSDVEGYEVEQSQAFTVNKTVGLVSSSWLKDGGSYSYGPVYWDEEMRTPGINKFVKFNADYQAGNAASGGVNTSNKTFGIPAFGDNNHPSWAKYVSIARTKEQNYAMYMHIPVKVMFYVSEGDLKNEAGVSIPIPPGMERYNNGKVYLTALPDLVTPTKQFTHLHLQAPDNIPFVPDSSCLVRLITPLTGVTDQLITPILDFNGQVIVCSNFRSRLSGNLNWSASGYNAFTAPFIYIEVFKLKAGEDKPFYEIPYFSDFPVSTFIRKDIDTYDPSVTYVFKNLKIDGKGSDITYDKDTLFADSVSLESPTTVITRVAPGESEIKAVFGEYYISSANPFEAVAKTYVSLNSNTSFLPDYRRIPDLGRRIAYNPAGKQLYRNTTVRYSNAYIQDSNVNGLSSFEFVNEYPLPTYRTPVVKLQPAGNVLLAIHQRTTSSLYIEESVLTDANGNIQTVKTDRVIGQDNELEAKFGSYHPESIAEWGSIVFGFDIFKGVVWMYNNSGQVPVSDYGMKIYFKNKADQYFSEKDNVAILGGIDPYHKEYLITFPEISGVEAETWAFNFVSKQWVCRMSFAPDAYGYINNTLVSFKNNKLWLHNQDAANHNKFYGVKYDRSVTIGVNPYPSRVKNFAAIQISAEELCEGDRYTITVNYANLAAFPGTGVVGRKYVALDTGKIYRWAETVYVEIRETPIVTCTNREGQRTYMKRKEFEKLENIFYSPILKDVNTPNGLMQAGQLKLRDGRDMISQVLEITIQNNSYGPARHHYSNLSYIHSKFSV